MHTLFTKLRCLTERQWRYKWDIADLWKQGEDRTLPAYEFVSKLLEAIESTDWRRVHRGDMALEGIIEDFKEFVDAKNEDYDEFDEIWDRFYDWVDETAVCINIWRL